MDVQRETAGTVDGQAGRAREVFGAFLKLGLSSFGGPVAHLGYFRAEFVERRRWLDEAAYGDLVALCQFLPGPASSQVGFALGLQRAGPLGALAAWTAFTLPSAILLVLFAILSPALDGPVAEGLVHGLKLAAVAVVAQAVYGMALALCPDRRRAGIALFALACAMLLAGSVGQLLAIALGALAGLLLCRIVTPAPGSGAAASTARRSGRLALVLFAGLFLALPLLAATGEPLLVLFDAFYRAGALVFGGGHVVLPLLEAETVGRGWMSADTFLAGYGAAQVVPGPLFTFAAYLGAVTASGAEGLLRAAVALAAIFLPGLLILLAVLPHWERLRDRPAAAAAMRGANAAVVGILAAALYDPVFTSAVLSPVDVVLALAAFLLLTVWKLAPIAVVLLAALGGLAATLA